MSSCPSADCNPLLLKCNYLFPFVCFCFPRPSLLHSFPVLSCTGLLALHPSLTPSPHSPHKYETISVIYRPRGLPVILTAPLWLPWWHPNSSERRSRPPPAPNHKALTPHLHTWGGRPQKNFLLSIREERRSRSVYLSIYRVCITLRQK